MKFLRWGLVVFETNDCSQFWDGIYNNELAPAELYIYSINFTIGGLQVEEKGDLTLVR